MKIRQLVTLFTVLFVSLWLAPMASAQQIIQTVAGGGGPNGIPAVSAPIGSPISVASDNAGNIFIADQINHRVYKVNNVTGLITTVAGTGFCGFFGNGGPATSAKLCNPTGVALDGAGNLFIADQGNRRIRKVDGGGTITTVAGSGLFG